MRSSLLGKGGGASKLASPKVRTGAAARGISPLAVSRIGVMQGNHSTDRGDLPTPREPLYHGHNFNPVKLGVELATNVGKGGPGKGRTLYRTGTQGMHGRAAQGSSPKPVDILSQYGPDAKGSR
jgi:hypothetical protein